MNSSEIYSRERAQRSQKQKELTRQGDASGRAVSFTAELNGSLGELAPPKLPMNHPIRLNVWGETFLSLLNFLCSLRSFAAKLPVCYATGIRNQSSFPETECQ